ncbi:MAG: sulfur oxidation c-type cytochrome SoxX [Sulfuricella sp.]
MQNKSSILIALAVVLAAGVGPVVAAENAKAKELTGRDVVFDRSKGNCLTCHGIPSDPEAVAPGNAALPFVAMRGRFPDRAKLRAQIWDASAVNPNTIMPPFGKHQLLTEHEIDLVTDYVQGL